VKGKKKKKVEKREEKRTHYKRIAIRRFGQHVVRYFSPMGCASIHTREMDEKGRTRCAARYKSGEIVDARSTVNQNSHCLTRV